MVLLESLWKESYLMIKKFASSSMIYAGSSLLFSIGRQIIFLPFLNKISPELFLEVSFLIVLVDFLIYSIGASIADYYVKQVTSDNSQYKLYRFLFYFSYVSIFSIVVFLFYDIDFNISLILALYILFYVLNTIQMKLFFNNLKFVKNYIYIFFRLLPYMSLLIYIYFVNIESFLVFSMFLLLSEIIAFYLFRLELKDIYVKINKEILTFNIEILYFILTYALFALVLRMDMFTVEYFFKDYFSEYYQMISVYLIFVNPIVLLTSASLLSILTFIDLERFIKNKFLIFYTVIGISISAGTLFYLVGEYVILFLYPENKLINNYNLLSFVVISTTLLFQVFKTFIIKYGSINNMVAMSLLTIGVPFLFIFNFTYFIYAFFIFRSFVFTIQFLRISK